MVHLDEQADDAHLDTGQRFEEQLESVDYDVWVCPTCQYALDHPPQGLVQPLLEVPVMQAPHAGDGHTNAGERDD